MSSKRMQARCAPQPDRDPLRGLEHAPAVGVGYRPSSPVGEDLLDAVLSHLPHGLCMFDAEKRLVLCNDAYSAMYRLPPQLVRRGSPLGDILAFRKAAGNGPRDLDTYFDVVPVAHRNGRHAGTRVALEDGRTVHITHAPMPNGGYIAVHEDVTATVEAEDRLQYLEAHDQLTGLPNRRAFETSLKPCVAGPVHPWGAALCIVDVDRFKMVNDTHGHAAGDELLQTIARRLTEAVRISDFVARLGGDEFAVVLYGMRSKADLRRRLQALVEAAREPISFNDVVFKPSISVGASFDQAGETGIDVLLKQADLALYDAKLSGRNRYCLFETRLQSKAGADRDLLDAVSVALAGGQFEVFYQPIVDLRSHIVRGWESLVRWRHPSMGLLPPARFMAALTDPRLSVAIGDFVLETSLRQMRRWLDDGVKVTCAGVNVSEAHLKRPDLVGDVARALERHGLTPDRLKLELVESAFIGQDTRVIALNIQELADFGVVSSLDDFGTGYASLTHLRQFRVERIKIDRSFVSNVEGSRFDQAIVRCIIALGRDLGIRITAEGIETVDQLRFLKGLGCDCGQGYLIGRPMQAAQVPAFLDKWYAKRASELLGAAEPSAVPLARLAG